MDAYGHNFASSIFCKNANVGYIYTMKRPYLWFIILALIWAVVQTAVFVLRFNKLPPLGEALYFVPMGILSGGFLIFLIQKAANRVTRIATIIGYLIACPVAFLGSLGGGLIFHPLIGATIMGSIPLILGSVTGYGLGKLATRKSTL